MCRYFLKCCIAATLVLGIYFVSRTHKPKGQTPCWFCLCSLQFAIAVPPTEVSSKVQPAFTVRKPICIWVGGLRSLGLARETEETGVGLGDGRVRWEMEWKIGCGQRICMIHILWVWGTRENPTHLLNVGNSSLPCWQGPAALLRAVYESIHHVFGLQRAFCDSRRCRFYFQIQNKEQKLKIDNLTKTK